MNYKSFRDSNEIELKAGFNVITGQNSSGKTALLEAMALQFMPSPHRSLRTVPIPGGTPPPDSIVNITFIVTRDELFSVLGDFSQPLPQPQPPFIIPGNGQYQQSPEHATAFLDWLSQEHVFEIAARFTKLPNGSENWTAVGRPFGKYTPETPAPDGSTGSLNFRSRDGQLTFDGFGRVSSGGYVSAHIASQLRGRIYRFTAERFNLGRSPFGNNSVLAQNAQNLPEALNTLQANPARFALLNDLIQEVLPQVKQVSVRAIPNQVQIIVWPHEPSTQREDLAIPLNDCGSGVGQVLAILYVVMTSDQPQVILIDEPQSFLHPGAVHKLIDVLKRYPQHQYVLSTHSPTVITAAEPAIIARAVATDGETALQPIDPHNTSDLQIYLSDIGARLADVFGADNVLWVEGQTEETCFPRVLKVVADRSLMGTAIVGIRQTGDLQGRDRARILEMYRRLSRARTLMPPAVAFAFDSECLTQAEKEDMGRGNERLVHFLPRRMYENFLLNAQAIAAVANSVEGFRPQQVREDEVQQLLETKRGRREYYCRNLQEIPADWMIHIDAARVLSNIFSELSENRVSYDKMKHSTAITDWILEHNREHFRELADWLEQLFVTED